MVKKVFDRLPKNMDSIRTPSSAVYVKKVAANFDDIATVKDDVFFGGVNI